MRRILLRLLLLAVFFNTAVGMPLHDAEHLRQVGTDIAQEWRLLEADEDTASSGHDDEVPGLCARCLACAHQAGMPATAPALLPALAAPAAPLGLQPAAAFVPSPGRWPFASRDPPAPT
ncbi:hypothetical protein QTH89_03530 [Variovorax sp. J22G21]|uniref:hypothetical protein n=1 Tax=Variovorax fucosicus TaxID=3053517 RepID=UPI0025769743|nr:MULTISPECIES: hypothetical protein [unclassified Variovorax]MDM0041212.1 hypothetical protein [Variovorax sp. J22R193]MDM0060269.1 hypothetical protein [Variovorax sp. J22G21]